MAKNKKVFSIALLLVLLLGMTTGCGSKSSEWDNLTKEEKEWYERNYGNGKSQQYDDAINNYRNQNRGG